MIVGELAITDGTTYIDLKSGAFRLVEWTPSIAPEKGGGVWNDNMLADNRRPVMFKRGNAVETFALRVTTSTQDDTIRETQELRRLLEKAKDYWTVKWQNAPVWLVARGSCETNTRYAYIMNYTAERDDDPYISPFFSSPMATMDEFSLIIERSDWLANPPGDGVCVAIASQQDYYAVTGTDSAAPTASEDDIHVVITTGASSLVATDHYIGTDIGVDPVITYASGIRFRGVAVPAGATILNASITVRASQNDAGGIARMRLYGELNAAPAAFVNYADFIARTPTINSYVKGFTAAWTAGDVIVLLEGGSLARILQEIIDLPGWAAGNNLAVLLRDNFSTDYRRYASWDNAVYTEPTLYVEWETGVPVNRGRAATCTNEVYFANKHNIAQLTNAYYYDAAPAPGYTDIMAAALPTNLFPAIPAVGDILYLGIDTTYVNSGPFSSVVFDIGTAANDILNVDWEYWNGGWANLTTVRTIDISKFFTATGVGSVSFVQPADWATTAVNGVTGYWIRCVIPAGGVGAGPTAPTQQNRLLYTVVRPSVDIDELQVAGDITALSRIKVHDYTDDFHAASVILATRSVSRGANFRMYLNASDEQNYSDITFTIFPSATFTMVANTSSPTGRCARYNPGAGGSGTCEWKLSAPYSTEYFGKFRVYLRVDRDSVVTDCTVRLNIGVEDPTTTYVASTYLSEIKTIASGIPNYLIDFGMIDIPGYGLLRNTDEILSLVMRLELANTTTTPNLYIYDLILVPVDEWAGEFTTGETYVGVDFAGIAAKNIGFIQTNLNNVREEVYLDVDSLNYAARIGAHTRDGLNDYIQYSWKDITSAVAQLQANKDQQIFAMLKTYYNIEGIWLLPVEGIGTLEIEASARYLSMRGAR